MSTPAIATPANEGGHSAVLREELELCSPIIILTYARSGAALLASLLESDPRILLIRRVDAVAICATLASSWRSLTGAQQELPDGAGDAIRSMIHAMILTQRTDGAVRWSTFSVGTAEVADSFAALYPEAKFICLYRSCADTIYSALAVCPWGLTGYGFDRFASAHPGNSVAALAEYWVTHTERLIEFERAHLHQCHRIRYEDFRAKQSVVLSRMYAYLGLRTPAPSADVQGQAQPVSRSSPVTGPSWPPSRPAILDWRLVPVSSPAAAEVGGGAHVPRALIPQHLAKRADALSTLLGYPPIGAS